MLAPVSFSTYNLFVSVMACHSLMVICGLLGGGGGHDVSTQLFVLQVKEVVTVQHR